MEVEMRVFASPEALQAAAGTELGVSSWVEITQERIDRFAEATGDRQWIHIDPERARRESPYLTTIAHGYLTLSMLPVFIYDVIRLDGVRQSVNYGSNRVRFPAPVPSGSLLRGRIRLIAAEPMAGGAVRAMLHTTVEIQGSERPACVAETMAIHYW
jgi:acyl dehydratase